MRVALVHDWLTGMRGGEKVLEELCRLLPGAPVHTLIHFRGAVSETIEAHPIRTSFLQGAPGIRRRYRSYLPLFPLAIEDFDLSDFDLVVSTSHCVAKAARARDGAVHVCYCHTPMRYVWDQREVYFPRSSGTVSRLRHVILDVLRAWDVRTSSRVDLFVANSRFVRDRILRYYGREAVVVPPPVDVAFFTPSPPGRGGEPGEPFVLAVAALAPYKRLEDAVEACERLQIELRIVGEGPQRDRLAARAGRRVRLLGRVGDEELRQLYRRASCLVQPGVEDFGIAAAEALACGCPVVALGAGGVMDLVDEGVHGLLFPAEEGVEGLAARVDKALRMQFNKASLRERAEAFSTPRFRERMQSLLQRYVSPGGACRDPQT